MRAFPEGEPAITIREEMSLGITTKDLARLCGVSRTTVHRALSGQGRINPDTKELILQTAREHDYRPDLLARGLVKGRTYYIGVVVLDVKNRYFAQMLSAVGAEAAKYGYCINITLHDGSKKTEKEQLLKLSAYHMDGILLSSVNEGEEYRRFLKSLGMPVVSVDNRIAPGIPFVGIDQKNAMREAAKKVLEKGYQRLVFVCPPLDKKEKENTYVHRERLKGFQEAAALYPDCRVEYIFTWDYLERAAALAKEEIRTAFVCTADIFALNIMKTLKQEGKRTPVDYGITGFDNLDILDFVTPRLVTVSNQAEAVAVEAVRLLMELIEKEENPWKREETYQRLLPYDLIAGETI